MEYWLCTRYWSGCTERFSEQNIFLPVRNSLSKNGIVWTGKKIIFVRKKRFTKWDCSGNWQELIMMILWYNFFLWSFCLKVELWHSLLEEESVWALPLAISLSALNSSGHSNYSNNFYIDTQFTRGFFLSPTAILLGSLRK